ncbi:MULTISPECIES: hypothetical protein [Streptomyces]|uniref:hypothetical protein n=1 Tax=Streptomyces TaxID=1883 RepID=UPI001121298C|nr:hypothetical protein [Streptomyces recifensis]
MPPHRQLTPVWRRRTGQVRLLLPDTPLGDGLPLYDLVCAQTAADTGVEAYVVRPASGPACTKCRSPHPS